MQYRYIDEKGSELSYRIVDEHIVVTDCYNRAENAIIPDCIEGIPVTEIYKKAFLGCKMLRSIIVGNNVSKIGDWAFSGCNQLEHVRLPRKKIEFGQGCFQKTGNLKKIDVEGINAEISELFAASICLLDTEHLLSPEIAGSDEWLNMWDMRARFLLELPDDDGFQFMVLCGEEDLSADYDEFCFDKQIKKANISMMRILNDVCLKDDNRRNYTRYIIEHGKGMESEASWQAVLSLHGDDKKYYDLLIEMDIINNDNLELILDDMGDLHAEMKAYVMNKFQDEETSDFFAELEL